MEESQRKKQYTQSSTSGLVLMSENRRSNISGISSEVTGITIDKNALLKQMGSKVIYNKPSDDKKKKVEKEKKHNNNIISNDSILTSDLSLYIPKTKETKIIYEVLLNFIQSELTSTVSTDILISYADEILHILKDDNKLSIQQKEIETLLRKKATFEVDRFSTLVNIGKQITDFKVEKEDTNIEDQTVPVMFDDEESEEDSDNDELEEDENIKQGEQSDDMEVETIVEKKDTSAGLDIKSINAHWLQGTLMKKYYPDALESQRIADDVFAFLTDVELNERKLENKLVSILNQDKFEFIKLLLNNRWPIVYAIRYARASSSDRSDLIEEMRDLPALSNIIDQILGTSAPIASVTQVKKPALSAAASAASALRGKTTIDLDALTFAQGGHFMSNQNCALPQGAFTQDKKGYHEIHVPALKPSELGPNERLVEISSLPQWAQPAFAKMKTLNRIQSRIYQTALLSSENVLLCAPTGAGKTNVAMLTILRELGSHRLADGSIDKTSFKIVYVAPMKSLVREMVDNFSQRLGPGTAYDLTVRELSGDQQLTKQQINETQIIVTTPEKWDIITRKSGDRVYTQIVKLLIIDEIHLLHDERGPVLESIIARMVRQIETTQELVRLVGLSATLPNYEDVATFLRVNPAKGLFFFDNTFRPCPLQQVFIGVTEKKAYKRHQLMNEIAYEKVVEQSVQNQQVLVFVHTRKDTVATARAIRDLAQTNDTLYKIIREDSESRSILQDQSETCKSSDLKDLLLNGFAVHHAGLNKADRALVEDLFAAGHVRVLVSTSTLAWGVNLPAHAVIIKGTQVYNPEKGKWAELSPQDTLQMLGRAGRPQYDQYGEGVIITTRSELYYYLSLLNQQLPIESQYLNKIVDSLNAEVVLGSVTNLKEAVDWLGYTYLYIRMLRSPVLYGVPADAFETDPLLVQRRTDIIHTAATQLDKTGLLKYDRKTGSFAVTDLGIVASGYYISHTSMATYNEYLKPNMSDIELFRIFALSNEFKYINIREEEKIELAKLLDKVPIPVRESLEESSSKVNVLLQAYISRLKLEGYALMADMVYVTQSAGRIMRCLFEICLRRGWANATEKTLSLCKMIQHKMWACQSPLRQFPDKVVPIEAVKRLEMKDYPWERLFDLKPQEIGEFIRTPKLGKPFYTCIHQLPRVEVAGHVQPITRTILRVELAITPDFQFDGNIHSDSEPFYVYVTDVDGETILHHEYFILKKNFATETHNLSFTIPIFDPLPPQYYVHVVSDRWLGSETILPISFKHLLLPEKVPPPTDLLDLAPLPLSAIGSFSSFYPKWKYFNALQTQTFAALYQGDSNVLIAAPAGSGRKVCGELAILRALKQHPESRIVVISLIPATSQLLFNNYVARFTGVSVVQLTGDMGDLRRVKEGQIIVSAAAHWDVMSRRWKTRKDLHTLSLCLVTDLHLISSATGHILETVVSRMRYMSKELGDKIRIVGLSASVSNARDLTDWYGVPNSATFNLPPSARTPLELIVTGYEGTWEQRQSKMSRPLCTALASTGVKPVLIFVPDRKQTRRVAAEIVTYAAAEGTTSRFVHTDVDTMKRITGSLKNESLKKMLLHGVGFLHDGLTDEEKSVVKMLFTTGAIQVCVVDACLCWGLDISAFLVIIMGTQRYDGREHTYVEYPLPELLAMIGRASRPNVDDVSRCMVFCHTPRKDFLKKFLYEPIPVESHLDHFLADHMAAEIVSKRIENVQEAVDYLTWTFLYRRLTQNPNYYNLQGTTHRHISDYLSELAESTLNELEQSKCIAINNEADPADLTALNLGMIASYYYIKYKTVELFSQTLSAKSKLRSLLEVLCHSSEFESLIVRHHEEIALQSLAKHLPMKISDPHFNDPLTKANILLQAHFSRLSLAADVQGDLNSILPDSLRLLQAMVDVISSNGWLTPALAAMEMSQMVTQGLWNTDSPLLQLPYFTSELAASCKKSGIETIFDLMDMDDDVRNKLLNLPSSKMADIARFCNQYPTIELVFTVDATNVGESVAVNVTLTRDLEDDELSAAQKVFASKYPKEKSEGWWLVLGDLATNQLLSIKRVTINKQTIEQTLDYEATAGGDQSLVLYLMSDSYMGCDQEHAIKFTVAGESADKMEE